MEKTLHIALSHRGVEPQHHNIQVPVVSMDYTKADDINQKKRFSLHNN